MFEAASGNGNALLWVAEIYAGADLHAHWIVLRRALHMPALTGRTVAGI